MDSEKIYEAVQEHYSFATKSSGGQYGEKVAEAFGYTKDDLENIPEDANLGLSCGNPLAIANLKEGETVIDLGSGAGFDVFLASKKVGTGGKAIGIDRNKDMLNKANRIKEKTAADNVSFVESPITRVALPDATADCIVSNCVVNLVPEQEKQLCFNEMFRLLKPGGRVAISDILLKKEDLPASVKENMALYVGCISGASQIKDYEKYLRDAGFDDVLIVDNKHDLNVYNDIQRDDAKSTSCCGPRPASDLLAEFKTQSRGIDFNEWAGSFKVYAIKPST